jgi:FkbM family methyltransferase
MTTPSARPSTSGAVGLQLSADEVVTASVLKLRIAAILTADGPGRIIGAVTRNRIRHQGLWFDTRSSDFTPGIRAQMFWGAYEGAETRMIRSFLRGSQAVIELGSSLGITAAHIASVMAPGGHLTCVEANPRLMPGLRERTSRHCGRVLVDVIHAAVTDHCGTAALTVASQSVGSRLESGPRPSESAVQVPALTLKQLVRQQQITEFDLVSDIEGAEVAFLVNDPSALGNCRRAVIELHETEFRGRNVSVFELMDASAVAGFQVIRRHGPVVALARP